MQRLVSKAARNTDLMTYYPHRPDPTDSYHRKLRIERAAGCVGGGLVVWHLRLSFAIGLLDPDENI